ncbi:hypothetical protein [Anaeromassilibacillus senegalensis]|uniref:hypothetical protein n=1 Tax=Anaeromassilibacillus senegalensis TaxID=1673717 RepID=UPI00067FCDDF|nr:hypothetical protein [Anaeromassilibacillus senegalensis]
MNPKKWNWSRLITVFVFLTLLVSAVFVAIRLVVAPAHPEEGSFGRLKSDYILMFAQCILGMVVMVLPGVISKKLKIEIPSGMMILFVIFLYCAIYLGEVKSFYYNIRSWDTVLHWFSGAMIGALGFSFVALFNNAEKIPVNLSPFFVAAFAFCFAVTLGVFWEFYEFTFDGLLGLNMQKFALEDGTQLAGRAALMDTMKDLVVDAVGAMAASMIGYISLKYKKGWIEKFQITRKRHQENKEHRAS